MMPVAVSVALAIPVPVPGLGPLLDRVCPLRGVGPLARLDPRHLVDLHLRLRGVLDMDVHQGWMHGN